MKTSMLEYYKIILFKVQFSKKLFLKEFRKSLKCLPHFDAVHLKKWIRSGCTDSNCQPIVFQNSKQLKQLK